MRHVCTDKLAQSTEADCVPYVPCSGPLSGLLLSSYLVTYIDPVYTEINVGYIAIVGAINHNALLLGSAYSYIHARHCS